MTLEPLQGRATPEAGDLIGRRYRLVRTLGEGGMGTVFEALDEELGGRVAIKLIRHDLEESPNTAKRFRREAEAAAAAGHEAIVGIFDYGVTDEGTHYLVMEFLVGMSLCDLLDEQGKLDIPTTAYMGCQVLSGLSAAHRVGVIHRDLKPDNVYLIDPHSPQPGVKILDFGTSLLVNERGSGLFMTRITIEGTVIGTPEYMSTEQAKGQMDIDVRTDLYSLGVIMYECLTGRPPFMSRNPTDVIYQILTKEPQSLRTIRAEIPEAFEALVMWAISKEREHRPQTCRELYEALLPFVEPSARDRLRPPVDERDAPPPTDFETRQIDLQEVEEQSGSATLPVTPPATGPRQGETVEIEDSAATIPMNVADVEAFIERRRALSQAATVALEYPTTTAHSAKTLVHRRSQAKKHLPRAVVILLFVGLAIFVTALGVSVGLWFALSPAHEVETVEPVAAPPSVQDDPGGNDEPRQNAETVLPTVPEVCVIRLRNLPTGARVYVDDALVDGLPLRLARGGPPHTLRVEAEGHGEFRQVIDPSDDQTIDVVMTAVP